MKSRLYLITDRSISGLSHREMVRQAVSAGVRTVQLREKHMPKNEIYREAVVIRALTLKRRVLFLVNDHVDIALAARADGVHLGQKDLPVREARRILGSKKIIGISTRTLKQAMKAESEGADYIGFGPLFETATKQTVRPKGLRGLREITEHVNIPVVAIGGIKAVMVPEILQSGASGVAVASGILRGDIKTMVGEFIAASA
jgi:thiamine-phosphate pyrophosphorylase